MHPAAAPLNSLAPQSAPTPAGNPQASPANPLTDPIPAHEVASLADGLHQAVQEDPSLHEAAAAIHLLARGEPLPDSIDEACCQRAAHLLLRLKHAGLLCQLAQARCIPYMLNVGASEPHARVLAEIGASWPRGTPVVLSVSTALPAEAYRSLHAFLLRPATLSVHIVAEATQDADATLAMAQALLLQPLKGLALAGCPLAPRVLRTLVGVEAHALHFTAARFEEGPPDGFDTALSALVSQSGATMLHIADDASIDGPLAASLLRCRVDWQVVHVGLSVAVYQLLRKGVQKVHRLEFHTSRRMVSPNLAFLKLLHVSGVNTLVVHGAMDLGRLAANLDGHSAIQGAYVQRIEACFMVRNGADVETLLGTIARNRRVEALCHRPMELTHSDHTPLSEDAAARFAAMGLSNRLAVSTDTTAPSCADWQGAVLAIAGLLAPHRPIQDLIDHLNAPTNRLIPSMDLSSMAWDEGPNAAGLKDKLRGLLAAEVSAELLRAALARCLRDHPGMGRDMCQALIHVRFPRWTKGNGWQTAASTFARQPLGEKNLDPHVRGLVDPSLAPAKAPPGTTSATTPSTTNRPLKATDVQALVIPPTAQGVALLLDTLEDREAALLQQPRQSHVRAAVVAIIKLLTGRPFHYDRMTNPVLTAFGNELLGLGQWRLLRHVLPNHRVWMMDVTTTQMADALAQMAPWPEPHISCYLTASSALPDAAAQKVNGFVQTVPPGMLHLRIWLRPQQDAVVWDRLAHMVNSRPGLELTLEGAQGVRFPSSDTIQLLGRIAQANIRHLVLTHLPKNDTALEQALIKTIRSADIGSMSFQACSASSLRQILPCRAWNTLHLVVSPDVVDRFRKSAITAETLYLSVPPRNPLAIQQHHLQSTVTACRGLRELEIWGLSLDIHTLAQMLDGQRSIHTVKCVPVMANRKEAKAALALMRRHGSVQRFEFDVPPDPVGDGGPHPLDADIITALLDLATRNRLRDPLRFAWGAGKGFARSMHGGHVPGEVGELISGMLDPTSLLALALTSKAAYSGAMRPWNDRIDALAALLAPATSFRKLVQELGKLIAADLLRGSVSPTPSHPLQPRNLVLNKVVVMRGAGLPDAIVGEVIGRRLHQLTPAPGTNHSPGADDLATVPDLLEAMAHVGAMPSLQWLRDGLGVDPLAKHPSVAQASA